MTILLEDSAQREQRLADVYDNGFLPVEHENYYLSCNGQNVKLLRVEFLILSCPRPNNRAFCFFKRFMAASVSARANNLTRLACMYIYTGCAARREPFSIQIETIVNVDYRFVSSPNRARAVIDKE